MSTPRKMLIREKSLFEKPWLRVCAALLTGLLAAGCEQKSAPTTPSPHPASVTLTVAVAEDSALSEAIARLRGEWSEHSGGELNVVQAGPDPLSDDFPKADLVVFASRKLGELCEAGYLRLMRDSAIGSDVLAFEDIFPAVREREIVYGKRVIALPLGCPTPLLVYREVDAAQKQRPPKLWSDLPRAIPHHALGEAPEVRQWAYLFLARAASYGLHPSREGLLFDPSTLTPRLNEPPLVRAMQEMASMGSKAPVVGERITSANALLGPGRSETILWPIRSPVRVATKEDDRARLTAEAESLRATPLPGAAEVYSPVSLSWEKPESPQRVTLLATSGRLIGVTSSGRNAASAFRLAAWLAGGGNSRQLSVASSGVACPRLSLAAVSDDWTGIGDRRLGREIATAHAEAMGSRPAFLVPRLNRVDEYLSALGAAAKRVAAKEQLPEEALKQVTARWEELTEEVGRNKQTSAYRRHLGLEEYAP